MEHLKEFTSFSHWSYHQSVVLGHTLKSVKNDNQKNIEWHDTVTGEVWIVNDEHEDKVSDLANYIQQLDTYPTN